MQFFKKQQEVESREEQEYKKGLATIKDLIAPSALEINARYIRIDKYFCETLFVLVYPRYLTTNWFSPIINIDIEMDIGMSIYPMDSSVIMKNLKKKVAQIESSIVISQEKGQVRDPMLETALSDAEDLRDKLQQGTERFFKYALYLTIYATSLEKLNDNVDLIKSMLETKLIYSKTAIFQMEEGFNSTLPFGNDQLMVNNNMNTSPLSTTFPFVSSTLSSNEGVLYGINRHNNSLIIFDRFKLENANTVIFAKSGAGKSYTTKLEILRSLMFGTDVIVIDPENEYRYLCEAAGGSFLKISLASDYRINPFDLPSPRQDEEPEDIIRENISNLSGLISVMAGGLSAEESSLVDKALIETYAVKDITPTNPSWHEMEPPTLSDFESILKNMEGGKDIALRINKYTEGTFAGIFNKPTNIKLNQQFVVFNIRDMEENLRPVAMYVILNFIWTRVRSVLKKRIMVVDEAWYLMQYEDSARFLFGIAKRARKYYLGLTTITQDITDFLRSSYGKPIVTNSSLQLLLRQSPAAIDLIVETFYLTEGEKYLLLQSDVGEGIFFAGLKHAAIKIVASYTEDQIITSDPEQMLKIEAAKEDLAREREKELNA